MNLNPARVLAKPMSIKSAIVVIAFAAYLIATFIIFFQLVVPSFEHGTTSEEFSVDSTVYVHFADTIREGQPDPWVLRSMAGFGNTLWMPVLMSLVLKSNFLIMLVNYAMAILSVVLLKRCYSLSLTAFIPLMLLNPTTTTSILCVNKEVVDFFVLSLFLFAREKRLGWLIPFVLILSFFNRWETCSALVMFMLLNSALNPLQHKRWMTIFVLILMLNFVMPYWVGKLFAASLEEVASGNTVVLLDKLQLNYLYVLAVVPKIADNLFGELLNHQVWEIGGSWLMINLFDNLAFVMVMVIAFSKRLLTLRNDLVYFAAIGSVIVAQSLSIQPRYFYFVYVLLCVQIALPAPARASAYIFPRSSRPKLAHA